MSLDQEKALPKPGVLQRLKFSFRVSVLGLWIVTGSRDEVLGLG